jgi:RNase P subunit RPR2
MGYVSVGVDVRLVFAYNVSMISTPSGRKSFVVTCKRCGRDVPSGREEFPFQSISVECPLCGELRRYLPSEVFLGRPDGLVTRQQRAGGR